MNETKTNTSVGSVLIVLSSLFYASYGIWTTLMGDFFGGYSATALRGLIVLIILVPFLVFTKQVEDLQLKSHWRKIAAMSIFSTLIWGLLYYSILEAGIGLSLTINYAGITIGMFFFGWLLAGEKFGKVKRIGAILALLGLILVYLPSIEGSLVVLPLLAVLISGLSIAGNSVVAKQLPYNTTQSTIMLWTTAVMGNLPMIFVLHEPLPKFGLYVEWVYLIIFSIASIFSSWLLLRGMKYIEAGIAGILGLLEIVFGVIFGVVFFGESVELIALLGVVVILIAAGYPTYWEKRRKKSV